MNTQIHFDQIHSNYFRKDLRNKSPLKCVFKSNYEKEILGLNRTILNYEIVWNIFYDGGTGCNALRARQDIDQ